MSLRILRRFVRRYRGPVFILIRLAPARVLSRKSNVGRERPRGQRTTSTAYQFSER